MFVFNISKKKKKKNVTTEQRRGIEVLDSNSDTLIILPDLFLNSEKMTEKSGKDL